LKRLVPVVFLFLLILAVVPVHSSNAQGAPLISVKSQYTLNRYGFATVNESATITNNGTSAVEVPSMTFGLGNLSSKVVAYMLTGSGFTLATPSSTGGPYTVSYGGSVQAGGNASFVLSALLNGVVTEPKNGSLEVLTLSSPSISIGVHRLINLVQMPVSTSFVSPPAGLKANLVGSNNTYSSIVSNGAATSASTSVRAIAQSTAQDFNPLRVYYASRTISVSGNGNPVVTDKIEFQNMGTTVLSSLYVSLLAPSNTKITIETVTEPRLFNPFTTTLSSGAIPLSEFAVAYPSDGVPAATNFTVTYQYPLGASYYTVSGGQVAVNVPESPPVNAFIDSYSISLSLPQGATASQSAPVMLTGVTPWQAGQAKLAYGLSLGWAIDGAVPLASVVFVLLLIGLFVVRTTPAEVQESEEEESSTELASAMIKAFDEKTNLINSLWPEIESKDPNELNKEYFDEIRGRLDSFRSRALQRLNEVKQKSTSQRFFEVVNQMQTTEREVDRAAKDKLNLYQQYYMRQMRKEVYERLLPQYTKRLERALNQLSDELHNVQREAKLL